MIKRQIDIDVRLTPQEMAFEFCNMSDAEQAAFFNELARITEKWRHPLCMQLQYLADNETLTTAARAVMIQIGEYAMEHNQ